MHTGSCGEKRLAVSPVGKALWYAVFSHSEHVSTIRSTWTTIWNAWWPSSGHELADAPDFERYGEEFDPRTGLGGLEIWVPIKA
jgi:AraC family transcriptional regulator